MKKIREMTSELLSHIDEMTDLLYQNNEKKGYEMLNVFIIKMEALIGEIRSYQTANNVKVVDEEKLLGSVGEAFKAMQEKDIVLLADIFSYDVKEQLEELLEEELYN